MTDLEDKIAAIIKEIYDATGFEDEGRADQAAHDIVLAIEAIDGGNNQRLRMALAETREALGYTDASISRCEAIIDAALR